MQNNFQYHKNTQIAVKSVLDKLPKYIDGAASEKTIAFAVKNLLEVERKKFEWFHDIQITVSSGQDTKRSKSSKHTNPGNNRVGTSNMINVDLKSVDSACVGDCSRSYIVENSNVVNEPDTVFMAKGISTLYSIHEKMKEYVTEDTQFHDLFIFTKKLLDKFNFENLVINNNFGHTVSIAGDTRSYIEKNNFKTINDVDFFSYNIHICRQNSMWGFRHENIYLINKFGNLEEL